MLAVAGKKYWTRFGWQTLVARDVAAVEKSLVVVPSEIGLAAPGAKGVILRADPAMLLALERWIKITYAWAKSQTANPRVGAIYFNSLYRPWGTTAGSGRYEDPCGCLDSQDDDGHWSGRGGDIPTKWFRLACNPIPTVEQINAFAIEAGLDRPWIKGQMGGEWWHYRAREEV